MQDGHADQSASGLLNAERAVDNEFQHGRNVLDVKCQYDKGEDEIANRHDGHHNGRETGNALDAAKDDEEGHDGENHGDISRAETPSRTQGVAKRVALHNLVGDAETEGDEHGKEDAHPSAVKSVLHIIGRTTVKGVFSLSLVKLCQGGFHKCCAGAKQCHNPHPEDRAWTANGNGACHTGKVACAYAAAQADGKGLERVDMALAVALGILFQVVGRKEQAYQFAQL